MQLLIHKLSEQYQNKFIARIAVTADSQTWVKTVELDGKAIGADENDNYNMPFSGSSTGDSGEGGGSKVNNGTVVNNSVIKMFYTPAAISPYYTTFETVGYASAEITYDKCKTVTPAAGRVTNYGPTPYVIKPGANVIVKLNGTVQNPVNGVVEFTTTAKSTITFEQDLANATMEGTLTPMAGSTVRKISKVSYEIPFDGERPSLPSRHLRDSRATAR